ncbi:MAG: cryptochrome/photolyase family protein [Chloroflexota bacterium]
MRTIWVFGDQLNRRLGALAGATPGDTRVLLVESEALLRSGKHVQRLHFVLAAMRRFAAELAEEGFAVDLRRAPGLASGLRAHLEEHVPDEVVATEPNARAARTLCERLGVRQVRSDQFLCHHHTFRDWAEDRATLRLEDFYRWNRTRLGYLLDGEAPLGGRWNFDRDNREPPPDDPSLFSEPPVSPLDGLDEDVLGALPAAHGEPPSGLWATSRRAALERLDHFLEHELARFGPYEDAMTGGSWSLAHSMLSPYLNLGLLLPGEVCDAVEARYRAGGVPINSAEGFIRQVIGWREYVWGLYWLWPELIEANVLEHDRPLPPAFTGEAGTRMRCLADVLDGLHRRAWVHHIPRLMVLSNLANLYGLEPRRVMDWMLDQYVDGAEWVMVPNVMGMGLWADGGRMASKPYISGGAYLDRMSDYCADCPYDPRRRTGDDACPFTTLYWDFLARHEDRLAGNHRLARPLAGMRRLSDLADVRARAQTVIEGIRDGRI